MAWQESSSRGEARQHLVKLGKAGSIPSFDKGVEPGEGVEERGVDHTKTALRPQRCKQAEQHRSKLLG